MVKFPTDGRNAILTFTRSHQELNILYHQDQTNTWRQYWCFYCWFELVPTRLNVYVQWTVSSQPKVLSRSRACSSSEWKLADIRLPIGNNNARLDDLQYGCAAASSFKDDARDNAGQRRSLIKSQRLGWRAVAGSAVCPFPSDSPCNCQ